MAYASAPVELGQVLEVKVDALARTGRAWPPRGIRHLRDRAQGRAVGQGQDYQGRPQRCEACASDRKGWMIYVGIVGYIGHRQRRRAAARAAQVEYRATTGRHGVLEPTACASSRTRKD